MRILLLLVLLPISLFAEKAWVQKHYIKYENIRTFEYLDSNDVFAFVDGVGITFIYKSTDQGNTWHKHYEHDHVAVDDSVYKVFRCDVVDHMHLYMSYMDGLLLDKSTDGGKTFERISFGDFSIIEGNNFYDLKMFNNNIGAGFANKELIVTQNNWLSYEIIEQTEYPVAGAPIFFIDSNNIAINKWFRNSDEFVRYNISENKWYEFNKGSELNNNECPKVIDEVFFVNDTLGYACGGQDTGEAEYCSDIIWKTTDRGLHWKIILEQEYEPVFGIDHISFTNDLHGLAVGCWGKIVETTDGGETWTYHEVPEDIQGSIGVNVTWAGSYPLVSCQKAGIYRLEEVNEIDEFILQSKKINIRQLPDKLLISIEDEQFRKYDLVIMDLLGNILHKEVLNSGIGTFFKPVNLDELNSGSYVYAIYNNNTLQKSGKFVIAR